VLIEVVAVFVGGIVKLIRLRRGECDGRGEFSSNRVGLANLGEGMYAESPDVGLGIDSLDNLSTSVNFASPRGGCCVVCGEFCGDGKAGTD
jgi:hypothetical protein